MDVKTLIEKCSKFYWSPDHPTTYTIPNPENGRPCGVGLIAPNDWAAFNLAWVANTGKWQTLTDQHTLVAAFQKYQTVTGVSMDSQELQDWVCLLTPSEFHVKLGETPPATTWDMLQELLAITGKSTNDQRQS